MSCSVVSRLCRRGDVFIGKCLRSAQMKLFIQTGTELRALDSEISCRKLSFIRKLFSSPNSAVIKRLAKLNL